MTASSVTVGTCHLAPSRMSSALPLEMTQRLGGQLLIGDRREICRAPRARPPARRAAATRCRAPVRSYRRRSRTAAAAPSEFERIPGITNARVIEAAPTSSVGHRAAREHHVPRRQFALAPSVRRHFDAPSRQQPPRPWIAVTPAALNSAPTPPVMVRTMLARRFCIAARSTVIPLA